MPIASSTLSRPLRRPRPKRHTFVDLPDEDLGILAAEGVSSAWDELYGRMIPRLQEQAVRLRRDADEADDLAHETMLRAWTNRRDYDARHPYRVWLQTILRNVSASVARHQRVVDQAALRPAIATGEGIWRGEAFSPTDAEALESETRTQLARVLASLTVRERAVLMACGQGAKPRDLASGASNAAAVRATLCRARRKALESYQLLYPSVASEQISRTLQSTAR